MHKCGRLRRPHLLSKYKNVDGSAVHRITVQKPIFEFWPVYFWFGGVTLALRAKKADQPVSEAVKGKFYFRAAKRGFQRDLFAFF
jgi:hypothetical protein